MKKFIISAATIYMIILSFSFGLNAAADSDVKYSRILNETTAFYDESKEILFYLPYSYYVKVISVGSTYTSVSYQGGNGIIPVIEGYIKTENLNIVKVTPSNPYPDTTVMTKSADTLFSDSDLSLPKTIISSKSSAYYYGKKTDTSGEDLIYVYCNKYIGYMRKSAFGTFTLALNSDPIETDSGNSESDKESESVVKNTLGDSLQIFIIVGISVIAISIVYLLFRPSGKVKDEVISKYNEEDE